MQPVILAPEEIARLLHGIKNPTHQAMVALAYGAGLKIKEIVALKIENIDFQEQLIRLDERNTLLPHKLKIALWRRALNRPPDDQVFINRRQRPFSEKNVQRIFRRALRQTGLAKTIRFQVLRHSFAAHLAENGIDLKVIQNLMGHKSPRTTQIYALIYPPRPQKIQSPLERVGFIIASPENTSNKRWVECQRY
ncbi:MAG: tyrosine-type recombinase/integrase [Candidatus Peregrinibacteria bacterium]